jgi:toxin-antitoxin system PIN domain toxin
VIAFDTNILVYGHRADAPFHEQARCLLRDASEGEVPWGLPWPCIHEFLAKVTHPRIFAQPTPLTKALEQVVEWLRSPSCCVLGEAEGYLEILARILVDSKVTGARVHDARIAAICVAHGVEVLWSADRDMSRFGHVNVKNPLS